MQRCKLVPLSENDISQQLSAEVYSGRSCNIMLLLLARLPIENSPYYGPRCYSVV